MEIEEIKKYLKEHKITYAELSEKSNVPVQTISKIFAGITLSPRIDTVQAIERALGLDDETRIRELGGFPAPDKYLIPLVGDVVCGKPIETAENIEGYVSVDYKNPDY